MSDNGAGGGNGGNGNSQSTARRLFRREGLVSDVDLRIDTAKTISRRIYGDENVTLDESRQKIRGTMNVVRGSRGVTVRGTFDRSVTGTEMALIGAAVTEEVDGGVEINAWEETQEIVGGAYAGTIVGAHLRLCAWADYMVWGGWAEIDLARCEIAALAIRSYMFYAHFAGARITAALRLVDDFSARVESFGGLSDSHTTILNLSSPGGGMTMEA